MNIRKQNGTFQFEEDPFSKNAQSISKIYHGVILLMECLQTKPQIKNMNISYYDLYYTVIKNRVDKGTVNNKYEVTENDFLKFDDFISPNHYIGGENNNEIVE